MSSYILRSGMIAIAFMNMLVAGMACANIWTSFFLIILGLLVSHKKKHLSNAMINLVILLMIGIPIAGINIPIAIIVRGIEFSAIKGNFYLLASLIVIMYFAVRHEKLSIPELTNKVAGVFGDIRLNKFRSIYSKYLIAELCLFIVSVILFNYWC